MYVCAIEIPNVLYTGFLFRVPVMKITLPMEVKLMRKK